jgi:hypothetical protein
MDLLDLTRLGKMLVLVTVLLLLCKVMYGLCVV